MNSDEINRYLDVGASRSICVDRRLSSRYPGMVRDVTIVAPADVLLEFNAYGYDEGGLQIRLRYTDLEVLVSELEKFLGQEIDDWTNFNRSGGYPEQPTPMPDLESAGALLKADLAEDRLELPKGWVDLVIPSPYWKGVAANGAA